MCSLRDHLPELQTKGAVAFGISVQGVASKLAFAQKYHLNFPILADADKSVSSAYGVLGQNGLSERVTFTIGPDGRIVNIDRAPRFVRTPGGFSSNEGEMAGMVVSGKWTAAIGKPVPSFSLKDPAGSMVDSNDAAHKLTVYCFVSTRCQVTAAYASRIEAMAKDYGPRSVRVIGIDSNRNEPPPEIATYARSHDFTFPVLVDTGNVIADRFHAEHTPEVWVVDMFGMARYHGAIDDSQAESGVKTRYLADALDALLAGKSPPQAETHAFGCSIKRGKR